jgi:hypothetical protein
MDSEHERRVLDTIRQFLAEKRVCRVAVNPRAPFRALVNAAGYDKLHDAFQTAPVFVEVQPEEAYVADIRFLGLPDPGMSTTDAIDFCQKTGARVITVRELIALHTQFSREPSIYGLPVLGTTLQHGGNGIRYIPISRDIPDIGPGICGDQQVRRAMRHGYRGFQRHLDITEFDRVWPCLTIIPVVNL